MSSVAASLQPVPRRQYVATGTFTGKFFTYEKDAVVNGVQTYILNDVAGTYLKGAILRENGRKLIKGVNPGDSSGELVDGAGNSYTYLVGVINTTADPAVAGFIDPNCSLFAPFNTDKPYFLDSPDEVVDVTTNPDSQAIGAPVYTHGDITTTAGNITATAGNITATAGNLVIGTGRLTVGAKVAGQTTLGPLGTKAITVTGLTASSLAFVSVFNAIPGVNANTVSYKGFCGNNTITITAVKADGSTNDTDVSVVNWFVVN
jgi:hypothetical protein